jgi:predicted glycoside hydrolase/deacetylase ChbG (UPF0249 family)
MFREYRKNIIISADDFGISRLASRNILDLARKNKIDRVEVMVSKNITAEEAGILLASGLKTDIHLHLVKEKIDRWQTEKRNSNEGAAKRISIFLLNYLSGRNSAANVEKEWDCQIEKFIEIFGRKPDGISSHEYIHFFPAYFKIFTKLSRKYSIEYIRFGKEFPKTKNLISMILNILRKINYRVFKNSGMDTSDLMISFDWIGDPKEHIYKIFSGKKAEIVFHPEKEEEYRILDQLP